MEQLEKQHALAWSEVTTAKHEVLRSHKFRKVLTAKGELEALLLAEKNKANAAQWEHAAAKEAEKLKSADEALTEFYKKVDPREMGLREASTFATLAEMMTTQTKLLEKLEKVVEEAESWVQKIGENEKFKPAGVKSDRPKGKVLEEVLRSVREPARRAREDGARGLKFGKSWQTALKALLGGKTHHHIAQSLSTAAKRDKVWAKAVAKENDKTLKKAGLVSCGVVVGVLCAELKGLEADLVERVVAQNSPVFALEDDEEAHQHGLGTLGKADFCDWVCQVGGEVGRRGGGRSVLLWGGGRSWASWWGKISAIVRWRAKLGVVVGEDQCYCQVEVEGI